MSWIVQQLLLNKYAIKSSIFEIEDYSDRMNVNLESDDYNNLLIVERKIKELRESEALSDLEMEVIENLSLGRTYSELTKLMDMSRTVIRDTFRNACQKIAFNLGGEFTDEGYLVYLIDKHGLNREQAEKAFDIIKNNKRI